MRLDRTGGDHDSLATLDLEETRLLDAREERSLLKELSECKQKLSSALTRIPGFELPEGTEDPQAISQQIASFYAGHGPSEARLGAVFHRYNEVRSKLAMANMRLVAHVAKRFRERGISYSDLLQEGFCGLLEAIDRFDLTHETKLATYATWWIRQSIQKAVAAGAYPVRLSPRHLRQLAQNQDDLDSRAGGRPDRGEASPSEMIQRIHAATRPTISLDAAIDTESNFSLLQIMSDPEGDRTDDVDMGETINKLMAVLRPREQQVLALRFGLGGTPRLSLSQVGKVLEVSKERIRQIQDRALEKLRAEVDESELLESVFASA